MPPLLQASHLKSYQVMRRDKPDKFVAYLVPYRLREERAAASEGGCVGGSPTPPA